MLTQMNRSLRLRGGGLAGDFRRGCWGSTYVLVASSLSVEGWWGLAVRAPHPPLALGKVVEDNFT